MYDKNFEEMHPEGELRNNEEYQYSCVSPTETAPLPRTATSAVNITVRYLYTKPANILATWL